MERLQNNKFYSKGADDQIDCTRLYKDYKKLTNDPEKYFNDILYHNKSLILDTNLFIPISTGILNYIICNNKLDNLGIYSLSSEDLLNKSKKYKNALFNFLEKNPNIKVTKRVMKEIRLEARHWEKTLQNINDKNVKISNDAKRRLFDKLFDFGESYLNYLSSSYNINAYVFLNSRILNIDEPNLKQDIKAEILNCDVKCSDVDKDLFFHFFNYSIKYPCTLVSEDEHIKFISINLNNRLEEKKLLIKNKKLDYKEHWHGFITYLVDFYDIF